jgi:hypothetical protein
MLSDRGTAGLMVSVVDPVTDPELAEIVVVPTVRLVAKPVLDMAPAVGTKDVQTADGVMSWVEPSVKVAVAVNCAV